VNVEFRPYDSRHTYARLIKYALFFLFMDRWMYHADA